VGAARRGPHHRRSSASGRSAAGRALAPSDAARRDMKIFDILNSREQQDARRFINTELEERLADPDFRADVARGGMAKAPEDHPEIVALRLMEMIGTYVKHDLVDADIVFDYWIPAVIHSWERLDALGVIVLQRATWGPTLWENFEELYRRAKDSASVHGPAPATLTSPEETNEPPVSPRDAAAVTEGASPGDRRYEKGKARRLSESLRALRECSASSDRNGCGRCTKWSTSLKRIARQRTGLAWAISSVG
jgi:hypothetical protein